MKFGICYDLSKADQIAAAGFDYIEGHVVNIAKMSDEEFAQLKARFDTLPIKPEAFCVLFPGNLKVTGPEVDMAAIEAYIDGVFPRLAALGAYPVVFGSGGARRVPDGFDRAKAWHQLIAVGRLLGEKAKEHGLVIALEPLNTGETNIINTQMEGLDLVADVNHSHFRILSDFYHLYLAGESTPEVAACGDFLMHAHMANPKGRIMPAEGDGMDYVSFFKGLKQAGYDARVSYEGAINDEEGLSKMLAFIKGEAAKAGIQTEGK
ncbi:MAG TPA: sugar phosphate isomerase/epimerase [Clostridiales bacterium]|nr:sugar phosphate isomerase/epimerase [Clostridiales bacterium]